MEIRQVVADMKHDQATKKLTFLEWSCAVFKKSWEELHSEVEVRHTHYILRSPRTEFASSCS